MRFYINIFLKFVIIINLSFGFAQSKKESELIIEYNNKNKGNHSKKAFSTVACPNANFSQGDFSNWVGTTGFYGNPSLFPGTNSERHQIIDIQSTDPVACDSLFMIPPGEQYSAKLGNGQGGAQSEKLSYNILVTPDNSLFIYKYAIVLFDPGHQPNDQPGFTTQVVDVTNGLEMPITENCSSYNVYAGQANQDFKVCGGVKWLNWKTIGLNLTPYMGRNLRIDFITRDCAFDLHFGYAYISAKCSALRLNTKICEGDNSITLSAPEGFSSYEWFQNGVQISNEIQFVFNNGDYPIGTVFECIVTSVSDGVSCPVRIQTVLGNPINVQPNFTTNLTCASTSLFAGSTINFQDTSVVQNDIASVWEWDFGDGTFSTDQNPLKVYSNPGNYTISLKVTSLNGCFKIENFLVVILNNSTPLPIANENQDVCIGNPFLNINVTAIGQNLNWYSSLTSTIPLPNNTSLLPYTNLYVSQTILGCESPRVKVTLNLALSPVPIGNENQNFCSLNNPTLADIISQGTNIKWYSSPFGSTNLPLNTSLMNGMSYYATQDIGCGESSLRLKVTISFDSSILNGESVQYFCEINSPTIANLVLNNSNIVWYDSAIGGLPIANNILLQNGNTYYASEITNQDCITRFAVKVVFDLYESSVSNFDYIFCDDKNEILQNITQYNPKKWYASLNSNLELNLNTEIGNESVFYFAQIDPKTGCVNPKRFEVNIKSIPCDVEVYNTITLNNNNQNDFLSIKNIDFFIDNELEIFDKYGKLVFNTNNYGLNKNYFYGISQGNNVFQKNKKLPTGTYYYVLNIKNSVVNINKTKKGFLYIINNE